MNYEVILERDGFLKTLCLFKTKKAAQEYMQLNYSLIEDWFEEPVDFHIMYCPNTRTTEYETCDMSTRLYVRKLTK